MTFVICAPPISSLLKLSPVEYMVSSTNHETFHYKIFSASLVTYFFLSLKLNFLSYYLLSLFPRLNHKAP